MVQTKTKYHLHELHEARHIVKEYFGLKLVYVENKKQLDDPWNPPHVLEQENGGTAMSNQLEVISGMITKISIVVRRL
jgi:heptaprenylglyceryl phosphate synthase